MLPGRLADHSTGGLGPGWPRKALCAADPGSAPIIYTDCHMLPNRYIALNLFVSSQVGF
jgi:hypothetical protein